MLARLNELPGVQTSYVNDSGTLIRVALRPGADPVRVAAAAERVLSEQANDRVGVPLNDRTQATTLQNERWKDTDQIAATSARAGTVQTQPGTTSAESAGPASDTPPIDEQGASSLWFFLLLACLATLWTLWRRHRNAVAGKIACPAA